MFDMKSASAKNNSMFSKKSNQLIILVLGIGVFVLVSWWLVVSSNKSTETQVRGDTKETNRVVESMKTGMRDKSVDKNGDGVVDISDL